MERSQRPGAWQHRHVVQRDLLHYGDFCLAVGHAGNGLLAEGWNGRKLRPVAVPRGGRLEFDAVSCTARNACDAVGR